MCANADTTEKCLRWGWRSTLSLRSCTLTVPACPCWETSSSGEGAGVARWRVGLGGGSAVCVTEECIIVTVLERWRGVGDTSAAGMGTHLPRTEWCLRPQHCAVHGTEGRRWEGQTDKAWQSAGQCSRAAPDGMARVCVNIPEPGNPRPHSVPPARLRGSWAQPFTPSVSISQLGAPHCTGAGASVEGWSSSSSEVALGHPVWDADPHSSPSATCWAPRKVSVEPAGLFTAHQGGSRLGFRLGLAPPTWNKPAVVLASHGRPCCQAAVASAPAAAAGTAWAAGAWKECVC